MGCAWKYLRNLHARSSSLHANRAAAAVPAAVKALMNHYSHAGPRLLHAGAWFLHEGPSVASLVEEVSLECFELTLPRA